MRLAPPDYLLVIPVGSNLVEPRLSHPYRPLTLIGLSGAVVWVAVVSNACNWDEPSNSSTEPPPRPETFCGAPVSRVT